MSVRFFVWRGFKSLDLLVKGFAKYLCHIVVKAKSRNDRGLAAELAVRASSEPVTSQAYNMLTAPITAPNNAVDHKFFSIGQIDKKCIVCTADSHSQALLFVGADGILRSVLGPVESGSAS